MYDMTENIIQVGVDIDLIWSLEVMDWTPSNPAGKKVREGVGMESLLAVCREGFRMMRLHDKALAYLGWGSIPGFPCGFSSTTAFLDQVGEK
jgi:hypothetical protein